MLHFLHHAEIAHATPGRVRLRVPHRRGQTKFFAEAERRIAKLGGVHAVSANRHTGSITIHHGDQFRLECVSDELAGAALLCGAVAPTVAPRNGKDANCNQAMVMVLQLVIAGLFGGAVTHLTETVAKQVIEWAFDRFAPELRPA
jgi:hypothetical protein